MGTKLSCGAAIFQPLLSGTSTVCSVAIRSWVAWIAQLGLSLRQARQICDTSATISNPPPTVGASKYPATTDKRARVAKICSFLLPPSCFLQCMPSRRGAMFRHVSGLPAAHHTPNFMRGFKQ
ncbi:hypothetical protein BKA66DRAFT_426339 [Pyrenochaeta sp. MPI-SDFR-AT-0127]|nr:hypothetical protein BKA66DRAFT_426339 [Pyrenochaeta sp. MPI-SDFR-AT-0127]